MHGVFNITRQLIVESHKVSKARNQVLKCSYHFEIWQAPRRRRAAEVLPNFRAIGNLKPSISRLRDFAGSYDKTSYVISNRPPGDLQYPIRRFIAKFRQVLKARDWLLKLTFERLLSSSAGKMHAKLQNAELHRRAFVGDESSCMI